MFDNIIKWTRHRFNRNNKVKDLGPILIQFAAVSRKKIYSLKTRTEKGKG